MSAFDFDVTELFDNEECYVAKNLAEFLGNRQVF